MGLPVLVTGSRTAESVGAYFDLITDEGRLFYGDSFHVGYFGQGVESLGEALDAHTDLVAELARVQAAARVLDVGCGVGRWSRRLAKRGAQVTGIDLSPTMGQPVQHGMFMAPFRCATHRKGSR